MSPSRARARTRFSGDYRARFDAVPVRSVAGFWRTLPSRKVALRRRLDALALGQSRFVLASRGVQLSAHHLY